MHRRRILFLAEVATVAHFVRPLVLADSLDPAQYDIHFHAPSCFLPYLRDKPFTVCELHNMPGERFIANIGKGVPPFPPDVIRSYVKQDCEIMRSVRPHIVIGDMRPRSPLARDSKAQYAGSS